MANLWECDCLHCRTWRATLLASVVVPSLLERGVDGESIARRYVEDLPPTVLELLAAIGRAHESDVTAEGVEALAAALEELEELGEG